MKKRKKQTGECHDCTEAKELIARKVLLHAQSCTECATLLRSLKRLVHYCSLEPTCDMPTTVRRELWVTIRREIHTSHRK
jgi:hypothetical protein